MAPLDEGEVVEQDRRGSRGMSPFESHNREEREISLPVE
jgi:hypothetical protein